MYKFKDYYQNTVELSFEDQPFSKEPKHVWVLCRYNHQWVLTNHTRRGYEFPGGKIEAGESPVQAAIREVHEETGGVVSNIQYIGQYRVTSKDKIIVKNIYIAQLSKFDQCEHYFETKGPVLLDTLPMNVKKDGKFSFIMKDDVLTYSMEKAKACL
ncbi:MAG: RNA deprotection pyrophosphohydrolase [Bacillaceae bacterium]